MTSALFSMDDMMIVVGTAIAGGLLLDIRRRLSPRQQIRIGVPFLLLGWIAMLCMSVAGPVPAPAGAAMGLGLFLTGVLLLVPSFPLLLRRGQRVDDRRN